MIENIKIKNFKSLVDIDLDLRNLNVLIGPNGAGKSNFLSFFQLLREGANEQLNMAINSMGGIGNVMFYGGDKKHPLIWSLEFSKLRDMQGPVYQGQIFSQGQSSYKLEETLFDLNKPYMSSTFGHISLVSLDGSIANNDDDKIKEQELVIAKIRDRFRYPELAELRDEMADWQIYHGFGEEALRNIRGPQLFTPVDPFRLNPMGRNLLSVIQQLANERRYEKINEQLIDAMKAVFPDFIKLYTPTSAGGMGSLFYGSKNYEESIPALSMSDGQLRFLGVMVALLMAYIPNPPSLIAIDEPEIGMHPKMIAVFVELLQAASQKTQIIITTHSPQLIDRMKPDDVIVTEKEDGKTTLRRLDAESLKRWLKRYTLGELWTMGKLRA